MSSHRGEKFSYVCGTDSGEGKSWNTMSRQIFSKPLRPLVLGTQMRYPFASLAYPRKHLDSPQG